MFRDLQDLHSFAPLHSQKFKKCASFFKTIFAANNNEFRKFCECVLNFVVFHTNIEENFSEFHEILKIFRLSDTNVWRKLNFFSQKGRGMPNISEEMTAFQDLGEGA